MLGFYQSLLGLVSHPCTPSPRQGAGATASAWKSGRRYGPISGVAIRLVTTACISQLERMVFSLRELALKFPFHDTRRKTPHMYRHIARWQYPTHRAVGALTAPTVLIHRGPPS